MSRRHRINLVWLYFQYLIHVGNRDWSKCHGARSATTLFTASWKAASSHSEPCTRQILTKEKFNNNVNSSSKRYMMYSMYVMWYVFFTYYKKYVVNIWAWYIYVFFTYYKKYVVNIIYEHDIYIYIYIYFFSSYNLRCSDQRSVNTRTSINLKGTRNTLLTHLPR